jgi:hypothetical protein
MIFYYSSLFFGFFLLGLFLRITRTVFHKLAQNSISLLDSILSDINDDEKINHVQKRTNNLLISLIKVIGVIIVSMVIGSIPLIIFCTIKETDLRDLPLSSFYSILVLSVGATVPFVIPLSKGSISSYSELSQLLHRMALDNYFVAIRLFKKEVKLIPKKKLQISSNFIIISGLARAGTTSLMNDLAESDQLVSLNYANMPFILSPNLWKKIYNPKSTKLKERSHKDGILIGHNSNEALEEFFFKAKAKDSYINNNHLTEYEVSKEDYTDYLKYQTIIKHSDKKTYLAKNNNFILRYKSIRSLNDKFLIVIMFREPLAHASSLMEKHVEYKKLQDDDPFVLEYMNWLGHHEFGKNQKSFVFKDHFYYNQYDKNILNHWITNWIYYYSYILTLDHPQTILIDYESYCKNPKAVVNRILEKSGIKPNKSEFKTFNNNRKANLDYDKALYENATVIYNRLKNKSLK